MATIHKKTIMNFFQQLHALDLAGDLKIVVTRTGDQEMIVSVFLANEKCGDKARNAIPPLLLRGTPQEIDEDFFGSIAAPVQESSGLMVSMEAYLKAQAEAKRLAEMNKPKTTVGVKAPSVSADAIQPPKPPTEAELKEQAYTALMAKVDDLFKAKKFADAIKKLPDAKEYADKADQIKAKKSEITNAASMLFA